LQAYFWAELHKIFFCDLRVTVQKENFLNVILVEERAVGEGVLYVWTGVLKHWVSGK
jgi:hypothetical protein